MADDQEYEIHEVPAPIFTGGLDIEQEVTLATIHEAIDRGQRYTMAMADGNEELRHEFEPLYRLLYGISSASVVPILKLINESNMRPQDAIRAVMAGVGGMFFFGGIEYAKSMGLNGVGVDLPLPKKPDTDTAFYPEEMPMAPSRGANPLEELLQRFAQSDDTTEE